MGCPDARPVGRNPVSVRRRSITAKRTGAEAVPRYLIPAALPATRVRAAEPLRRLAEGKPRHEPERGDCGDRQSNGLWASGDARGTPGCWSERWIEDRSRRHLGAQRPHDGADMPCCRALGRDPASVRRGSTWRLRAAWIAFSEGFLVVFLRQACPDRPQQLRQAALGGLPDDHIVHPRIAVDEHVPERWLWPRLALR